MRDVAEMSLRLMDKTKKYDELINIFAQMHTKAKAYADEWRDRLPLEVDETLTGDKFGLRFLKQPFIVTMACITDKDGYNGIARLWELPDKQDDDPVIVGDDFFFDTMGNVYEGDKIMDHIANGYAAERYLITTLNAWMDGRLSG